ncbi:TlpA disulfide reductase family protein [Salicola sp. Rm-C-2C1-2]|uniref:TlpA family protein disulfide reductase n=1 Tax=Salicola sp. Rm-C-2C1-2 TaxID=3141321 RepID=UPI0032E3B359
MIHLMRATVVVLMLALAGCDGMPGGLGGSTDFATAEGGSVRTGELKGQWVFVNYWAEWCKPCYEEIPELNALDQRDGVRVLGVNFDQVEGESLRSLKADMGIAFTVVTDDPQAHYGWEHPVSLPATFVISPDGGVVEARFGKQTEEELVEVME